ncbi:Cytidine deaminase-like protein [Cordyceps fumosorosea ARSEF 2679]|uniref:Cytidine deaminase-like protein n=1 Tax=Cordyceps fumosorosea (strain ARSEF 2679) TaxID=1081104 RepID=A0A167LMN6_CORFA|nr:Cytidine deaminase-like protein [Cordyceps fumosorosea ARSEF 2679]OAA53267.1 Cytidine deaminase-like protein [Cordyceps fumosorosea ARSEF 2679]
MTSLKSVKGGLRSSFHNMVRRLLRKPTPAGDGSGGSSPAGSQQLDGPFQTHLGTPTNAASSEKDLLSPPSLNHLTNPAPTSSNHNDDWSQSLNGDFSDIVKSHAHDDEAAILRNAISTAHDTQENDYLTATTHDSTMAPARPLTEHTRSTQRAPSNSSQIPLREENKENVPPEKLADSLTTLKIVDSPQKGDAVKTVEASAEQEPAQEIEEQPEIDYSFLNDPVIAAERAQHLRFIGEALDMARLALKINETPVGCVLVHDGKVIARGMNATNVTRNGTRHAEYMALAALFSYPNKEGPRTVRLKPKQLTDKEELDKAARLAASEEEKAARQAAGEADSPSETEMLDAISETLSTDVAPHEGNEDGKKGHLYPYGQKMLDVERVDRSIVSESVLYVTVEPCIMCASLLRQLKIRKVYFGAVNDKFGGTGGVFSLHANSLPVREDGQTASAHPIAKPIQLPDGTGGSLGVSFPPGGGDGGNVDPGYEIEGGWGRDDAVALLRRFYVQENGRAPVPRKKEGRAARLAAIMGQDGVDGDADDETVTPSEGADTNGAGEDVRKPSSESSFDEAQLDGDGDDLYEA